MALQLGVWEVTGGAAKGGLVVRAERDASSPEIPCRLATGALVLELEYDSESQRMRYEKVTGSGPQTGWVSTVFRGKELLIRTDDEVEVSEETEESAEDIEEGKQLAMQLYCARFGEAETEDAELGGSSQFEELSEDKSGKEELKACAELEQDLSTEAHSSVASDDSDSDMPLDSGLVLCQHCGLPVGQTAYAAECGEGFLHGECAAERVLRDLRKADEERKQASAATKKARREEFEIGWKVEHIPRNVDAAARMALAAPQGMCCLLFDQDQNSVHLAPTVEPAAAVNLEYLSTALDVRRREHREPLFSLDPVDAGSEFFDPKQSMQVKRFEPAWLAGTTVGEVLFQSDYHLKELSMGEYEQPVIGMKSCHEFSCDGTPEWSAREWYVVRKAEVQMSSDSVLMPCVKMGVEAREQILSEKGLEDVKTMKPNHPLVRYAEAFTHNFDLIAERKSVVFHLRELAKASVLAKFLIESDVELDDAWFNLAAEPKEACSLEIPQLWNDLCHTQIQVQDGKIVNADADFTAKAQSLYGGVQFGLDKFQIAGARQPARLLSAGLAARQFVQPARHLSATLSAGLATRQFQRSFGPVGVQPARVSAGVGLDKFALAGARQPARLLSAGLAARQFVQPARHLSATLSAGLATRQFQRSFGPVGVQPARVSAGVGLDKFALTGARQPARLLSAGLAARQFVQPARHLSATLSAGLATRQFQRSFGPVGVQPARVSAGVGLDKFALTGARQPARLLSAGLAARQFVQPARHLSATLSAGLATRQFQRSFGPVGVQPARVSAGVGLDKFALAGARQPARLLSAGLAARQFVQPARHLSATLSAGLATRQFQRSFGPVGVQPARVSAGVGLDKFALTGARQPARLLSAGLAARQFVQPARHLSATLSAGLATRQFQRSFGPVGVQPARVSAGVGLDKFALTGARQPARLLSAGLAARQFVQPARHLSATLSAGLATRQFQRSFGPVGVQPARVSAGVGLDKFALTGARQPARLLSAGLAARQFVQPARHLSATLSAGLATRQFQRSFGPVGVQPARVSAGVGLDKFALTGARQPARLLSAGLAARQFVQPARHLSATLSAGLATRQFQRSFGPVGVQPARVSAGVGLDKFALAGARQPARLLSAGLAARQFVQPARHLSATLSAGLATRQFQRSFGPVGVQPARVSAGVGLDKFALTGARQPARLLSAGLAARQFVQPARHLSATLSAGLATRQFQRSFGPVGVQPARVAGVDLNLDEFNLAGPTEIERQEVCALLSNGADISKAFWPNLSSDSTSMFNEEDKRLLQKVFNPLLSDRQADGDCFVPPDTSFAYVQKLRTLVKEEEAVQQQRKEHFLSKGFLEAEPGPLFPLSWVSSADIARRSSSAKQSSLLARSDYKAQAQLLLKSTSPVFEKVAEDGTRFRIYKCGGLEVRTIQEHNGEEVVGVVFSSRAAVEASKRHRSIGENETVVKVTERVERSGKEFRCYTTLETDKENVIVVEERPDGTLQRLENPADLEERNSVAKVIRSAACNSRVAATRDLRSCPKGVYCLLSGDDAACGLMTR